MGGGRGIGVRGEDDRKSGGARAGCRCGVERELAGDDSG